MSSLSNTPSRTVLLSVLGSTPAVLTETIWALAQQTPPVIPDLVVVVTTTHGRETLEKELLVAPAAKRGLSIWQALRRSILGSSYTKDERITLETPRIVCVPEGSTGSMRELDDIRSAKDNAAAAECILDAVRLFTTNPDTRVIGLLAGGRKTMGALLHAAVSLAGRSHDRLLHVLVNPPFDHPGLEPRFYFCGQPGAADHRAVDGTLHGNQKAIIELADVPIVALGELIAAHNGGTPATFSELSRAADNAVTEARDFNQPITLRLESKRDTTLYINHNAIALPRGRCTALAKLLWRRALADAEHLRNSDLQDQITKAEKLKFDYNGELRTFEDDDVNKALNDLRTAIKQGAGVRVLERLMPLRSPIGLNRDNVKLID